MLCASPWGDFVQYSKELCKKSPHPNLSQTLHDLTLKTGQDETLECSWVSFSFGKENQTRIPRISLTVGCWDFSTHLENRLCCNTCVLSLTGFSFSAHHFLTEAAQRGHDSSTFPWFFLLFCHSAISQSLVLKKNFLHLTPRTALCSQTSIQQSTWQPRDDFCPKESWADTSQSLQQGHGEGRRGEAALNQGSAAGQVHSSLISAGV